VLSKSPPKIGIFSIMHPFFVFTNFANRMKLAHFHKTKTKREWTSTKESEEEVLKSKGEFSFKNQNTSFE
jgi:hypothetical protein